MVRFLGTAVLNFLMVFIDCISKVDDFLNKSTGFLVMSIDVLNISDGVLRTLIGFLKKYIDFLKKLFIVVQISLANCCSLCNF